MTLVTASGHWLYHAPCLLSMLCGDCVYCEALERLTLQVLFLFCGQCAVDFPDKIADLYNCGVSEEGYQLFKKAGRRQRELATIVTEVPMVAFNEVCVCVYHYYCALFI